MSVLPTTAGLLSALLEGQNIMRRELEMVRAEVAEIREALARTYRRTEHDVSVYGG